MKLKYALLGLAAPMLMNAQNVMTPEILWTLKKINVQTVSPSQDALLYSVGQVNLETEKTNHENFLLNLKNNQSINLNLKGKTPFQWDSNGIYARKENQIYLSKDMGKTWTLFYTLDKDADLAIVSPDGKKIAFSKEVLINKIMGKDIYKDLPKTTGYVFTDLNHRHWDHFNKGKYNHIFVVNADENTDEAKDIIGCNPWDCPQQPGGGQEDFTFSPDSSEILFVLKPYDGVKYMISTNTDIFSYNLNSGTVKNLTESNKGYDMNPKFSPDGKHLAWLSMATDGYEADKNELKIMELSTGKVTNITKNWDESIDGDFSWDKGGKTIYFTAAYRGTKHLFSADAKTKAIKQVTDGQFDVNNIYAQNKNGLVVGRTDVNHNTDLYSVNLNNGKMVQLTNVNKEIYAKITPSKSELKMVKTTDGKEMGVWFFYPPNFDPQKKYPSLLYCQGGPQSALTPFFSVRWNFALMAAQGYIVIAPNRRGMPGWGVKWNADISKDWGGQPMKDYLSAADYAKTLPYIDGSRMGCVGASYGGYSVFMLAGIHKNRFKTFIAHDGLFDMKSWYLTTDELWFANWDLGGSPYDTPVPKSYTDFNPSNFVKNWNRPIMIIQGGTDYRVPYEQGQEAFQAAKLKGLKTQMLYFPNENHWVLNPQNGLLWQREFFKWLKETL